MILFPVAKINIGLRILERRADGYHNIETLLYPVSLADALEVVVRKDGIGEDILTVTGVMSDTDPEQNLVMKALRAVRQLHDVPPLKIYLHKNIPAGSGLGGGSSDAAAMLKLLERIFGFGLSGEEFHSLARSIGSDVPFFIRGVPAFAEGAGDILSESPTGPEGYHIVILSPGIAISTARAYATCRPSRDGTPLRELLTLPVSEWRDRVTNDFEITIFRDYPQLAEMKEGLYEAGALYASLSGSGSALYGIFDSIPQLPPRLQQHRLRMSRMI